MIGAAWRRLLRRTPSPSSPPESSGLAAAGGLRRAAAAGLLGLPLAFGLAGAAQAYEGITISAPPDAPEGHSGLTNQTFEVRLTGPVSGDVNYKVCFSGTATYADDYNPTLGGTQQSSNCVNGRIGRGRTTPDSAIGIAVVGDEISESGRWRGEYGETVTAHLTLVGAQPWDLDGRRAHTVTHTILNDDVAVSFRQANYEGREGKRLRIQVDLVESTQGYPWNVTVPFTYTRGTASSGDYDASRTSLTFRRGEITQDLYVDLTDDSSFDSGETFTIDLDTASFPTGMYDSGIARARVTIKDNDYSISASSSSHAAREDAGGVSIPVTISPAQERTVGLRVGFTDINASRGQDYLRKHHSFPDDILTFHPGETAKWIFVPVVNDGAFEQNELFKVTLTQTVGATDPETVDIIIKDHRPGDGEYTSKLILERTSRDTVSEGQSATFRLTMHPAVQEGSTVAVLLSQSADDGVRANWIAGAPETHAHYKTVSFARGESVKTLTVPIRSDRRDTNGTLTVAAMAPGDHPASTGPYTARGQKVVAKVRILDTTADGNPHSSPQQTAAVEVPSTAVTNLQVTAVDGNTAKATWDAVPHATGYEVEWDALDGNGQSIAGGLHAGVTATTQTIEHQAPGAASLRVTVAPEHVDGNGDTQVLAGLAATAVLDLSTQSGAQADSLQAGAASCDLASVKADVNRYILETQYGTAHVARWKKALAGLNRETGGMTAAGARQMKAKYSPNRWDPVVDALQCIEGAADETPAPADPVVSVTGGGAVTEGGDAVFTVMATPAPAADLDVTVAVSDDATADFLASGDEGTRTVTILAGQASATLRLPTVNDATDEPDGSVSAILQPGTGHAVADPPADAAKVLVSDDDDPAPADPVVSVSGGGAVTEGGDAVFTVAASPAPAADLDVTVAVSDDATADFLAAGDEGTRTVTILAGQASATLTLPTVNDAADEPDGSVGAALQSGTGYAVADPPADAATVAVADDDVAAAGVPTLSVNDVEVKEGPYRRVEFTVTLSKALEKGAWFYYRVRESSPVSAKRGVDFSASTGKKFASIRAGATEHRIMAALVIDDSHDEDPETFEVVLSDANGAAIADAVGVATIVNDDPMPAAFLARFGRTVAEQALDGIAGRIAAPRAAGMQGAIAGQALSFNPGSGSPGSQTGAANDNAASVGFSGTGPLALSGLDAPAGRFGPAGLGAGFGHGVHGFGQGFAQSRTMTGLEALLGSSFTATGETDATGGSLAFWGLAAQSSFDGREGTFSLDGETTTAMLGADYARGRWLVGLALMQSSGEGGYADRAASPRPALQTCPEDADESLCNGAVREGDGDVEASLTAAVPYAAIQSSERLRLWGAAGYGTGEVTLKPAMGGSLKSDLSWTMAAAGARSDLLQPPKEGSGPTLALTADALWARTSSEKTHELAASDSDVTRLRLGLEGGYAIATEAGGRIVPRVEIGARHDGGDAETGFGVELGGGIAWTDPAIGLSLDLSGRTLIAHGSDELEDRGFAASLAFDPDPATRRGPSLTLRQRIGGRAEGGLDALFATDPLADRAGTAESTSRWQAEAAYGLPAFSGRFTGSPHVGLGLATGARDYTLGWRLSPAANANAPDLSFGVKATRRESDTAAPEHIAGFELRARW